MTARIDISSAVKSNSGRLAAREGEEAPANISRERNMPSSKPTITALVALLLILTGVFVLTGCGGVNPTPGSNSSDAAMQTVVVILTQTAQARPTGVLVIPTSAATATPSPEPVTTAPTEAAATGQPEENSAPAQVETPGGVPVEPTRNVVYETPDGGVPTEAYHEATVEPTSGK